MNFPILLPSLKCSLKSGQENLTYFGKKTNFRLIDFWRWSMSDILSNSTRGKLAEFIVGTAVGTDFASPRDEWDCFDIKSNNGIKIEVKSAAYIQSWDQKKYSTISFSIKKAKKGRSADVYVFCLLKHRVQDTINPLNLEQWSFFVLPTHTINNYKRSQISITLNSLSKLTKETTYENLNEKINRAYHEQQTM